MKANIIMCGDNLQQLSELPDKSIDLIYADPPFFSNRHYEIIWNDGAELRAFQDRWKGGINHYIKWMRPRLRECHRALKDTGSMYLHCDWHANAHLRILMDKIFGESNFRNEIIWCYTFGATGQKQFSRKHDTIFYYTKGNKWAFNRQAMLRDATSNWAKGKRITIQDWWTIPSINTGERIGYPTQKPEALLKRIIEASSNKGDIVLDPFCGCGTTIAVAQQLGRQWIGIDVSPTACRMMSERLNKIGVQSTIIGMPETIEHLKALEPFNFQEWVINRIKGTHNNKKSGDMGIDGWTFLKHEPIQVKQSENIGRNVIDNFETAIRRASHNSGEIYAFSFTNSAYEEVARAENQDDIYIKLIPISKLLLDFEERQNALQNKTTE